MAVEILEQLMRIFFLKEQTIAVVNTPLCLKDWPFIFYYKYDSAYSCKLYEIQSPTMDRIFNQKRQDRKPQNLYGECFSGSFQSILVFWTKHF